MRLCEYLRKADAILAEREQIKWFLKLEASARKGMKLFRGLDHEDRQRLLDEFASRVRTEELKAWYSSPEGNSLFQGTSVSSLTIPCELKKPFELESISDLERRIVSSYIELHDRHAKTVKRAIIEDVSGWLKEGLYYGVALSSKIISQAFDLTVGYKDVVFKVDGFAIDPHEITSYPDKVRRAYFKRCLETISVFDGIDLEQSELESSLVLADISKPKISKYKNRIILAPVRCNEIAALMSRRITKRIIEQTSGRIMPKGLTVVIYDTDTPYTYHRIMGHYTKHHPPILPGLIVLGSSGTIDAFRWLYAYRLSLISQKIMKSSLYSQAHKCFIPFVFYGVLVPRDAEILLDMKNLHRLRYRGNIDPELEFSYLTAGYYDLIASPSEDFRWADFKLKHNIKS